MDDDWGDWSAPPPAAAAAAAQTAQQQALPVQSASAARQPLDPALFAQEDEFGGFEAAPVTLPPERADQQHHATQQQREGQAELVKGDLAWLLDGRSGAWLHARVVSVDRTVHPPSYGVELPDGSYRETEAHRLLPRQPGAAPPPAANGHHAPGSWAAAAASPFDQPAGGPAKAAAAVAAPPPAAVAAAAAGPAAAAAAEDEEDDFGEWAAAGALPLPAAQAAAPRPAAAAAAPGSPRREGAMVHAAPASAHGSPQRLPTRSSAPPSPMLDRFRSFLHAAAPQVSEQLELEEAAEEQRSAVEQQRHQAYDSLQQFAAAHLPPSPRAGAATAAGVPPAAPAAAPAAAAVLPAAANGWEEDDFGSFEAAEPPQLTQQQPQPMATLPQMPAQQLQSLQQQPQSPQQPQQPAGAATPRGVQRDAPLPLDLFGEEPIESGAAKGIEPAMQPCAAAAPAALAPVAAAVGAAAVGAAATAAAPAPAAAGTAGSVDGWDDDFADFVSSPPAAAAEAATTAVPHPAAAAAAAAEQQPAAAQPAAARQQTAELGSTEQHAAELPPAGHVQGPAAVEADFPPLPVGGILGIPVLAAGAEATATDCPHASVALAAAGAGPTEQPTSVEWDGFAAAAPAPPPPLPVPQQQPVSPSSVGSAGSRQSALMATLHPVSSTASSARSSFEQPRAVVAAAPAQQWGSMPPAVPLAAVALSAAGAAAAPAAAAAAPAAAAATPAAAGVWPVVGQEVVQEYAVAWARLLEATAAQLQASAMLWAEAASHGCWQEVQQLPAAQRHLAACAQLYHESAIVRLAAQQLGLFSLVGELQEAWAQVEAAWLSTASLISDSTADGDGAEPAEQQQQPAFRDAALAAWEAACGPGASSPAAVQSMLQSAAAQLGAMSLDDFPRMLAWSQGLCGLTLLPLSLFEGALPVANWEALAGRPCLVPLANLWLHRVSSQAPQLD